MSTPYGTIVGRVVGAAGAPVPGATVAAIGSAQPHRDIAAITSADGTFRFGSMVPGLYRLEARASGTVRSADVAVAPGARADVEIRLGAADRDILLAGDQRMRVTNYLQYPWRCVCSLLITAANGSTRIGTGWLAAQRLVVTAGHCIHMADEGGWAARVEVIPGRNGGERPYGSAVAGPSDLRSVPGWTDAEDPDFDYGAILLPAQQRFGAQLGWFGWAPRTDAEVWAATLNVAGYPGDGGRTHEEGTQWYASGGALEMGARQMTYAIATSPGQGGAPVWLMTDGGERYCVAIHTWAGGAAHGGTRVTREVYDNIAQWAAQAP